jgi:hypothetical protein
MYFLTAILTSRPRVNIETKHTARESYHTRKTISTQAHADLNQI